MNRHCWIFVIALFTFTNTEINRKQYKLKNDIVHLQGSSTIEYILDIDPNRNSSWMETEIQKSTDICCVRIQGDAHLKIDYLPKIGNIIYPQIIARLYLRKPLQSITLNQQAKLKVNNRLKVYNMTIRMNEYSYGEIDVEVLSNISIYVRNTAKLVLSGLVMDTAHIFVRHAGELDAISCQMNRIIPRISEYGVVYAKNEQSSMIRILTRSGSSRGSITFSALSKFVDLNKIQKCFTSNSSKKQNISFLIIFICLFVCFNLLK